MRRFFIFSLACLLTVGASAQRDFQFAHVSDTHIGGAPTSVDDLRSTVKDINANPELKFVIITGDITEFGADAELREAKTILDSLNKPWYVIPGNHDGPLVHVAAFGLEGGEVHRQVVMHAANGERFLVVHGHEQDSLFGGSGGLVALLCGIGERIGEMFHERGWRRGRNGGRRPGYEAALAEAARRIGADGVICGHSHAPADRMIDGLRYLNCGDWLGNCTAIVEGWSGEMRLLRWGVSEVAAAAADIPELWIDDDTAVAGHQ